jgi:hypothetical protein
MATAPSAEPAKISDVQDCADLFFNAFSNDYFQAIFPPIPEVKAWVAKAYDGFVRWKELGRPESVVYVVRGEDGRSKAEPLPSLWLYP